MVYHVSVGTGMCGPKGYVFLAVWPYIGYPFLIKNGVCFYTLALHWVCFFRRSNFFGIIDKTTNINASEITFSVTVAATTVRNRVSNFWTGQKYVG